MNKLDWLNIIFVISCTLYLLCCYISYRLTLTYFFIRFSLISDYNKDKKLALSFSWLGPISLAIVIEAPYLDYGITFRKSTLMKRHAKSIEDKLSQIEKRCTGIIKEREKFTTY